ncbi:MAG: amino acid ABC transporter ATP-binding protein [Brevinema sp.]
MHINIKNIVHSFQDNEIILNNLNYEDECSSLALIGPSGGGKSTLLRIFGGLITPKSGQIYIDHAPIYYDKNSQYMWHQKVSFVFQSNGLFPHFTALQNITLPLEHVFHRSSQESTSIAMALLERFELLAHKNKYPSQLSGGQQQRIAIARAAASRPELLLLDEPTSALDPEYTADVLNMIHELTSDGLKIILVTHEMGFARNACEKALFLYNGEIIEHNKSDQFFQNPQRDELKIF